MRNLMTPEEKLKARQERTRQSQAWHRTQEERRVKREVLQNELREAAGDLFVVRTLLEKRSEDLAVEVTKRERRLLKIIRFGLKERDAWTEKFVLDALREHEKKLRPATEASRLVATVFAILGAGPGPEDGATETNALSEAARAITERAQAIEERLKKT